MFNQWSPFVLVIHCGKQMDLPGKRKRQLITGWAEFEFWHMQTEEKFSSQTTN